MNIFNSKQFAVIIVFLFVFGSISLAGLAKTDAEKLAIDQATINNPDNRDIIADTEDYCTSTYTNQTDDWITNVTFNTINNETGQDGEYSYGDYTSISTDVTPGATYTLSVTFYSEGQWTEHVRAWFDWNADEVFDTTESYYLGSGVDATLTMDITIPSDAVNASTRLRVIEQYYYDPGADGACDEHTTTYGETEDYTINIGEPLDYDAAAVEFLEPGPSGQQGETETPTVTFANYGALTISFDVSLVITFDGETVYEASATVEDIESGATIDVVFDDFTPEDEGDYVLTATAILEGDENTDNNMITMDFSVGPAILPPVGLSATSNQDGVVPLSWLEPGTAPCEWLQYDDGVLGNAFYYYDAANLIANEFVAVAPIQICTLSVHVLTEGDDYWPWPDDSHDPVGVKVFDDDGTGVPGDMLAEYTVTADLGMDIVIPIDPPIECSTDHFWVSFNNTSDSGPYDGMGLDDASDYAEYHWVRESDVWYNESLYDGDRMIRASIRSLGSALTLTGNNPVMDDVILDTQELTGYNIYRDTESDVEIDPGYMIASDVSETEYDDMDVTNGTDYYYVVTAVYDDSVESGASNEVMGSPADPGELTTNPDEITFNCPLGDEGSVEMELINNGGLDVTFSIEATTDDATYVVGDVPYNTYTNQARFSSIKYEGEKTFQVDDQYPPMTLGSGGPDAFGYIWIDSDEPDGPTYGWIDPSTHEILTMTDDDNQGPFSMEFDFPFYGQTFNTFRVCSNGFISFTSTMTSYNNLEIPSSSAPLNLVAPFWEDLDPTEGGAITWHSDSEMTVVSWVDVPAYDHGYGTGPLTFQVILYPSGKILFQYEDMNEPLAYSTIGIQDAAGSVGLQVAYNQSYVYNGLATLIKGGWLRVDPITGVVPAGSSLTVDVFMDATDLEVGLYTGDLNITCYDINHQLPDMNVPVTLDVYTGIDDEVEIPKAYALSQNFPNPFNASTSIEFTLPEPAEVELIVYNMLGQRVATLVNERLDTGFHSVIWDASDVSSGVYFYKLVAGDYTEVQELTLLK